MIQKYYTPSIEDIRVGYECEDSHTSQKFVINSEDIESIIINISTGLPTIKTPYLTKEQIVAEEWQWVDQTEAESGYFRKEGKHGIFFTLRQIIFEKENPSIVIKIVMPPNERLTKYSGKCPSINEFRTICKLLNI